MGNNITDYWMNRRETVKVGEGEIVLKPYDITALLDEGGNVLNPLLGKVKELMDGGAKPAEAFTKGLLGQMDVLLEQIPELRKMLNGVLKRVIMEPDMQQFDVDNFTLQEKIAIFSHLIGGTEGVKQVEKFRREQSPIVADILSSTEVQQ